jgi:hypothetical protein
MAAKALPGISAAASTSDAAHAASRNFRTFEIAGAATEADLVIVDPWVRWFHFKVATAGRKVQKWGEALPFHCSSAIRPTFAARLNKGCRGGGHADSFVFEIVEQFQRSNEHLPAGRPACGVIRMPALGEPNAQAEDQVGRQKALQSHRHG